MSLRVNIVDNVVLTWPGHKRKIDQIAIIHAMKFGQSSLEFWGLLVCLRVGMRKKAIDIDIDNKILLISLSNTFRLLGASMSK